MSTPSDEEFKVVTDPVRIEHFRERLFRDLAEKAGIEYTDVEHVLKANGFRNLTFEETPPAAVTHFRAVCVQNRHPICVNAVSAFKAIVRAERIKRLCEVSETLGSGLVLDLALRP
jgi:hypothetical protein